MTSAPRPLTDPESVLDALRASGGRITEPRRVVVEAMLVVARHATADDLLEAIRTAHPRFSAASLYRTLHALESAGAVESHRVAGGSVLYHLSGRAHAHLVCEGCGAVVEIPSLPASDLRASVGDGHGFTVDDHGVMLAGRCRACRQAGEPS